MQGGNWDLTVYDISKNALLWKIPVGRGITNVHLDSSTGIVYVVTTESGEEKAFFDALTNIGIETKTKDLQIFYAGAKKADWDVGMAVYAVKMAPKLDAVILATGDGDFVPLVEYLKNSHGTQVEVISFGKSSSARLIESANDFIDMSEEPKKFLMPHGKNFLDMAAEAIGTAPKHGTFDDDDSAPMVVGSDTDER